LPLCAAEYRESTPQILDEPIVPFTIDFEPAKQYRESRNMDHRFRKTQWNNLVIEVYL